MATRLCSRAVTLLIRRPEIRIVRTLEFPREYPKRPPYVPWTGYLALCVPAYFAWQTIYWEAAATDVVTQQMIDVSSSLEEVIDLPTDPHQVKKMNYRHVRITGHFEHEKEVLIVDHDRYLGIEALDWNWFQKMLSISVTRDDKRFFKPDPGHFVVTPFLLSDGKTRILVNRGWVPKHKADPSTRASGQIRGQVQLTGYVRTKDESPWLWQVLLNSPETGRYQYRDIRLMAKQLGTLPIYVDVDRESAPHYGTAPLGGQTSTENYDSVQMYSYLYALCAFFSFGIWFFKYIGPIRYRRGP